MKLFNIWRHNPENLGDTASSPFRYIFNNHSVKYLDYGDAIRLPEGEEPVVVGGSGLIHGQLWFDVLKRLASHKRKKILWGIGHNVHDHDSKASIRYPDWILQYDLIGLRDWLAIEERPSQYYWVPDASCLHHAFAIERKAHHDIVVYEHLHHPLELNIPLPRKFTNTTSVEEALDFISSGRLVLTNTYHGAYWATLLNRPCIILRPFSSKFYKLKWPQPIAYDINDWRRLTAEIRTYPNSLDEAIDATMSFALEVQKLIER